MQITAPHRWLQLMAEIGITNLRIRAASPADQPTAVNLGSADRPHFQVLGILTSRNELRLPGGTFRVSDRQRISDYFARLAADGPESLTSPRGRFGLTEKDFAAAHADLAQPIDFITQGQSLRVVLDRLQDKFTHRLSPDAAANQIIRTATPVAMDVGNLTAGTGLAIVLRHYGLALRPAKQTGEAIALRIVPIESTHDSWPIGWDPPKSPRETAPILFESLNVEIDGYTLAEALDALAPRLKLPLYWDQTTLSKHSIDPAKVQVHLPRTRTYYKRILDRLLAQARLHGDLRVDEAGTEFLWISR